MYEINEKDYCKYPSIIDVIDGRAIIGYYRCPKCGKSKSIAIHEIYEDGELKVPLKCKCGFYNSIKLKNWKNKRGELKI